MRTETTVSLKWIAGRLDLGPLRISATRSAQPHDSSPDPFSDTNDLRLANSLDLTLQGILNHNPLMSALPQAGLRGKRRPRPSNLILYLSGPPGKAALPEVRDELKH